MPFQRQNAVIKASLPPGSQRVTAAVQYNQEIMLNIQTKTKNLDQLILSN